MAIVCEHCGEYAVPSVDKARQTVTCNHCRQESAMNIFPLFIVTGASGAGKTSVVSELRLCLPEFDVFETDVMWAEDWQAQRNNWLRVAHSVAQNNRISVLCGTMMPEEVEKCDHFQFFSQVHYAILHCGDQAREARLRSRPTWRNSGTDAFIAEHKKFAHWLLAHAGTSFAPPAPVFDTTEVSPHETAVQLSKWIRGCLAIENG